MKRARRLPDRVDALQQRAIGALNSIRTVAAAGALLVTSIFLVACGSYGDEAAGDAERGARLFSTLPCSGCHGAMAQGQFGPTLAGTDLSYAEVRRQVRSPRDRMPAFPPERASDQELRDIYAWLTTLPPPSPTRSVTLPPAEATRQALDSFYAEMTAADLMDRMDALDEVALRVRGTVVSASEEGRYSHIRLRVGSDGETVDVVSLFDTGLQGRPFPAAPGERVTLYGVGARPAEVVDEDGSVKEAPQMQVLHVRKS